MWEAVETKAGKTGVAKTKGRRSKRRSGKKARRKGGKRKRKQKREKTMKIKKVAEKWEIWDDNEEAVKSEAEAKKLVPEKFHR